MRQVIPAGGALLRGAPTCNELNASNKRALRLTAHRFACKRYNEHKHTNVFYRAALVAALLISLEVPMVTHTIAPPAVRSPALFAGRYHLLHEIGTGTFSRVFLAQDSRDAAFVAIKQLRQSGLPTRQRGTARQNFRREAHTLTRMRHPRIPRLFDASLDAYPCYLTLEYISGETLEAYLQRRRGRLPLAEVLDIGLQLCEVLGYLHSHQPPIKFRDLKPANIMRRPDGQLLLIDFGLACPYVPGRLDTVTLGTPGYAAPEQYPDPWGRAATTPQSDLYSLGVTLHQLLSGEHPGKKPQSQRFCFSPLPALPPQLAALVAQMLLREPERRVGRVQEVQQRLKDAYQAG